MSGSTPRRIQITELMDVLRSGLAVLIPVVERIGIPWNEDNAYDDWDTIASTLYEQLVVNTARNSVEVTSGLEFPKYDLIYPSYDGLAHFRVILESTNECLGYFVGFEATTRDFRNVKHTIQSDKRIIDTTSTRSVSFSECNIHLCLPGNPDKLLEVLTLTD